jgi:UDP-N-acetylmuramate dehydrogenase
MTNESLKKYNSFKIGGNARYLVKIYNEKALLEVMKRIKRNRLRYLVIGAGTNILFRDQGYDGVVIKLMGDFKKILNHNHRFVVGAGVLIKDFLKIIKISGYGGVEFLAGIPGSIGGAVRGNAGAFGHSISERVKSVVVIDSKLRKKVIPRKKIVFNYRYSNISEKAIITAVGFWLKKCPRKMIEKRIRDYLKIRWEKQPRGFSAGSFFKNPLPLSAGQLIEECGLKGKKVGGAFVSKKHANFIINTGEARASDVIELMKIVKDRVKKIKGINLEPEVRIV